jgi:hypothetical protein
MALLPDYFLITDFSLRNETNKITTDSVGLQRSSRKRPGQRWAFTIDVLVKPEDAKKAWAFLSSIDAGVQPCTVNIPGWTDGPGSVLGIINSAAIGADEIRVSNNTSISVGDLFKLSNHDKIYQCTSKSGSNDIGIYPQLQAAITTSTTADFSSSPFLAYLDNPVPEMQESSRRLPSILTLQFVEAT